MVSRADGRPKSAAFALAGAAVFLVVVLVLTSGSSSGAQDGADSMTVRSLQGCGTGTCVPSVEIVRGGIGRRSDRSLMSQAACEAIEGNTWTQSHFANWVKHGGVVYLSGKVGRGEDITTQAQSIFSSLDSALADAGTDKSYILTAEVFLADIGRDFGDFNAAWDAWLAPGAPPVRAAVQAVMCCQSETNTYLAEVMISAAAA